MDPNAIGMDPHLAYLMPFIGLIGLIFIVIVLIPTWIVCKKAGFTPWLSLLIFVPLGGVILLYVLAFARWKVVPAPAVGIYPTVYPPTYPPAVPPANPGNYPQG